MPKGIPNKKYTGEFQQMIVETMQKEGMSYSEEVREFDVCDHHQIMSWERIYFYEGSEGLYVERRGRKSTGRPPKQIKPKVESVQGRADRVP